MAFPPHIQVALKILPHLIEVAKKKERTTYEGLAQAANMETRLFAKPLTFIRDEICLGHNLPPLTVLVDNKGSDKALNSFLPGEIDKLTPAEYQALKEKARREVYDYPRWDQVMSGVTELFCLN